MKSLILFLSLFFVHTLLQAQILSSFQLGSSEKYIRHFPRLHQTATEKYNYVDSLGKEVISEQFEKASLFSKHNIALVQKGCCWGVIDVTGKFVVPAQYSYLEMSRNGYILAALGGNAEEFTFRSCSPLPSLPIITDATWGAFDSKGKKILPFEYDYLLPNGDYLIVTKNNLMGLYNVPKKTWTFPIEYEFIGKFDSDGKAQVRGKKTGIIGLDGQWITVNTQ